MRGKDKIDVYIGCRVHGKYEKQAFNLYIFIHYLLTILGTPLMRAVESGSFQIVNYLLERGAKLNLKTKNEKTSLDIAYEWGSSEIIDLISSK